MRRDSVRLGHYQRLRQQLGFRKCLIHLRSCARQHHGADDHQTATWGSDVQSCVYDTASAGCSIGTLLSFGYVEPDDNTHPAVDIFGHWEITNNRRTDLTSLTINALAGGAVFDRCFVNTLSGGIAPQDSNATLGLFCAPEGSFPGTPAEGTAGSNVRYSAAIYLDFSLLSAKCNILRVDFSWSQQRCRRCLRQSHS